MKATLFRGVLFGISVFVFAALLWSVARAEVIQTKVRITGEDRTLRVVNGESNQKSGVWLDKLEFNLVSRESDSVQGSREIDTGNGQKVYEQISVMKDPTLVARFQADPKRAAQELGLMNPSEAACPPGGNAILIWTRSRGGQYANFGNCLEISL